MSLSAELKDFTSGFKSSFDMYTKYKREKDLADYRKAKLADQTLPADFGPGAGGSGGASGGASGGTKLSPDEQKQTARKIYSSLLDKGYNTNAAAGITGNLWHESGGFGGGSGDSGSAHGIAQWRGDRWTKMQEFAKARGKDPNDLNTQVDYLDQELRTDYKSAYNLLQHAGDVKTATGIFADQYEKPAGSGKGNYTGINGWGSRLNFASQVSNFGGGAIGTKSAASPRAAPALPKAAAPAPRQNASGGMTASLGTAPPSVATAAPYMGAPPPEAQIGQDTTSSATDEDQNAFAMNDQDQDPEDVQGAARGGLIKGYARGGAVEEPDFTNVEKGVNTNYAPAFRKSLLNLQQQATAAGIKTKLISGVRTLQDQKELYANMLAGKAGKPLPFPKRGAVKVAAVPGTSPHERGVAADLLAVDPKQQGALDKLAAKDPNLQTVAGDPGHYQLNSGGKGGAPDTAVASAGKVPPPPPQVEEEPEEDLTSASSDGGQPEEERSGSGAQAMADATERGRANQTYMASEQAYTHQRNMQESAANEQALSQEAVARSTPPPPAAQAQPQEAEGAARGGLIKGYAPGGVVDATGYIAPSTATLSSATQALMPAVAAAAQATPASPVSVPTTTAAVPTTTTAAPAATTSGSSTALTPVAGAGQVENTFGNVEQSDPYGVQGYTDPVSGRLLPRAAGQLPQGMDAQTQASMIGPLGMAHLQQASTASSEAPVIPAVTGTDRGSVWNPTTNQWEAGAGYTYDQTTKGWVPASGSNAAKTGYAGGGSVRGYADGGDVVVDDEDEGAVSTAPAPAPVAPAPAPVAPAPAPAAVPAQPTVTGDARTRVGAPSNLNVGAPVQGKPQPPPPNLVADALHDGLMHLTKMFGLDKLGAVQDPDAQARVKAFNDGAGAADGEAMHAVHRAVDPNHQMTQQELATASVAALKSYYDSKGQPEAGAKAIGEIMQHQKAVSAHFSATAAQAFQQGDVPTGLKFLKASYDQVPDGQHIDAQIQQDGTVAYRLTDSHSGRVIHQGTANAQQLAKLAQVGATGTPYVKAVATSAARAKTPTAPGGGPPMPPPRPDDLGAPAPAAAPAVDTGTAPPVAAPAATPPVDDQQASAAPAGGSGAYLAQRQAALTSGVSSGAVDTGPKYAQADTGTRTDATVDGKPPKVTVAQTDTAPKLSPAPPGKPVGMVAPGNIDLAHRPIYKQPDGRISTVNSIGVEDEDGKQVVIPTIIDGKQVSNKEAWAHYLQTGEFLGKFDTVANANQFARDLHRAQAEYYKNGPPSEDEAVPTDGKKPLVTVPDTPLVRPDDKKVTPTVVPEKEIPKELTTPVVSKPEKADQEDVPEVAPVTPRNVSDDYDLTPKTFDKPPPNPDDYFDTYKRTLARFPHGNTAVRKALGVMYTQANTAYREADAAWKDEKGVFETEEGKRLQAANEQANRAQGIENTTASEQHGIDMEKRKEVLTKNQKAQERKDTEADTLAAQQAGLNKEETARIVARNKEDRDAARHGDEEAQKRLDKVADDLATQRRENDLRAHNEAIKQNQDIEAANAKAAEEETKRQQKIDDDYRAHNWDTDKEARALAEKTAIKPPNADEQKAIDEKLSAAPKDGTSALDDMYASFMDPDTGEKYTDLAKMKKDLGTSTVNGIRELVGHLVHVNGITAESAVDIAKQLINVDLDTPGPTDDQSDYPGRRDHEPEQFFKVAPQPDKAGNPIIKVPGYAAFRISPEMGASILDMQKSMREHGVKVRGWGASRDALTKVRGDARSGTAGGAVDAALSAGRNILFPTKPVTTNEPVKRVDKKFGPEGGFKFERAKPEEIDPETKKLFPELQ